MSITIEMPSYDEYTKEEYLRVHMKYSRMPGVYVLYGEDNSCLYIGKSINLYARLQDHIRGRKESIEFYKDIRNIRVYVEASQYHVEIYETYLINEFMPLYNKGKVFYGEHIDRLSVELADTEERLFHLEEERRSILYEIEDFSGFAENAFQDERVIYYAEAGLHRDLRELDRKIHRLMEKRSLYRRRYSVAGGM